jgi:hypothetical protein
MSQTQETGQEQGGNQLQNQQQNQQPPVARAEEALNRAGRNIGLFAGLVGQRLQRAAVTMPEGWQRAAKPTLAPDEQSEQPEVARAEERAELAGQKATEQAEQMVDQAARRLGNLATTISHQAQKAAARLREEGEDIWFEAQHLRQQNTHQQNQQK